VDDEDLRLAIYDAFARTGQAPAAETLDRDALHRLAAARHIVLDGDDNILMAHPFTSINLGFSVMGRSTLWWGGCAWDSFAVPHLVPDEPEVLVATRCPACRAPHAWVVGRQGPPPGTQVAHFLVPAAQMWQDILHTCGNQQLFCSEACVAAWLAHTGQQRGYVLDLATLWRLAQHWYDGRLERGYTRREPAAAAAYFRSVGLAGPFWGL
jgi:Alkylmercury lyase